MVSQAIAPRNPANRPFVLRKGISVLSDLADGGAVMGYPGDYYGRIYFVNNITGNSAFDGLSWATPFAQVSEAITASEAFRQLPGGATTTNDYQRNIIYVQGTETAYTALTALPNYCDIIGIGAEPRGNGGGIARISQGTGTDTVSADAVRGLYMANMQLTGSGTGIAMDLAVCFRSTFENCVFVNKTTGGVRISNGGGIVFRDCQIGGGDTVNPISGLLNTGDNFNNVLVENCYIHGTTYGVTIGNAAMNNTWFKDNYIYGGTAGVLDQSLLGQGVQGAIYTGNYVYSGSAGFTITTEGSYKTVGNYVNVAGNGTWVTEMTP